MESVFECDFTPTVRKAADRIRRVSKGATMITLLLGIGVFSYVFLSALRFDFRGILGLLALFSVFYLLYCIFMPEIRGYFWVKQFKKEAVSYHVSFGDKIEVRQGNILVYWEYTEINQVIRLKHYYELQKNKRMGIMLDPDGFTKGTFSEFKQFLRAKRPDLNIPE